MVSQFNYNYLHPRNQTTVSSDFDNYVSVTSTDTDLSYQIHYTSHEKLKIETEKERILRIAKEKMFASWKMHNQKTEKIIQVKQICKPRHRLSHMGRRKS